MCAGCIYARKCWCRCPAAAAAAGAQSYGEPLLAAIDISTGHAYLFCVGNGGTNEGVPRLAPPLMVVAPPASWSPAFTVFIAFAVESDLRQRDPSTQKMGLLLSRGDITETVPVPPDICNKIY